MYDANDDHNHEDIFWRLKCTFARTTPLGRFGKVLVLPVSPHSLLISDRCILRENLQHEGLSDTHEGELRGSERRGRQEKAGGI